MDACEERFRAGCTIAGFAGGAARMSGAFTRTLDMLGLGSRPDVAGVLAGSKDDDMLQRQVPVRLRSISPAFTPFLS